MSLRSTATRWLRPAVYLGHNGLTLTGAVITTSTALTLLAFWMYEIVKGGPIHPYTGIVFFLVLPGVFLLGLFLMPIGVLLKRNALRRRGQLPATYPQIDLTSPVLRRAAVLVAALTFVNATILGVASYRGVEYMDSAQFCGQTCHTVMQPEYTAYRDSPHSRLGCVECHIGPGAPWFVKAKISGVRQVFAVSLKTYSRPIPSPVRELRPARDTCEQCHWPQRFLGERLLVKTKYGEDEKSTPSTTVLVLKLGGRGVDGATGIHGRHLDEKARVSYVSTDGKRQVIPQVSYRDDTGKSVQFDNTEKPAAAPAKGAAVERREMDCMDCHNRPTHTFQMPARALDEAIAAGRISRDLPFIKKQALAVLSGGPLGRPADAEQISSKLVDFYRTTYPAVFAKERPKLDAAIRAVQEIYRRNVFPDMNVTWGTYPNTIGHDDFPGCFRCHDGNHKSGDGKVITAECDACHSVLAMDETNPKILADLGFPQR
jgi:nitrate/TMAO reductase-like tetraheme cytochrome c subunit